MRSRYDFDYNLYEVIMTMDSKNFFWGEKVEEDITPLAE